MSVLRTLLFLTYAVALRLSIHFIVIELDAYPIQFRQDLLVHDTHRHPYMERLSVLYMMKLRYGDKFGSRAGSAWRLIFVMALMPWLRRYRLDEDKKEAAFEQAQLVDDHDTTEDWADDDDNKTEELFMMRKENTKLKDKVTDLEGKLASALSTIEEYKSAGLKSRQRPRRNLKQEQETKRGERNEPRREARTKRAKQDKPQQQPKPNKEKQDKPQGGPRTKKAKKDKAQGELRTKKAHQRKPRRRKEALTTRSNTTGNHTGSEDVKTTDARADTDTEYIDVMKSKGRT